MSSLFQRRGKIRTRFEEILKVRRGEDEHFARAVAAEEVVAFARPGHLDPAREVFLLLLRFLREEIVGDAQRQFAALVQFLDDGVVLRVILKSAARVNDAREAEPVQFAHEMARGIHLMLRRQLRSFGERGVKNRGVRTRDEQAGGIAAVVALDFAAGRIGRVLRVTAGAQRRLVQQRAAIQMQDENRRIRRGGVDFVQRRHPAFGELKLAPAADHAHPLAGRRALRLFLQHAQSVGERWHAVPAQFHVVVQSAANDVQVRVVQSGNDAAAFEVNHLRVWPALILLRVVHADDAAVLDGEIGRFRILRVERGDAAVVKNQVCLVFVCWCHITSSKSSGQRRSAGLDEFAS